MKKTFIILAGLTLSFTVDAANITFADPHVKAVCVEQWDTNKDGELSEEEAAAVTGIDNVFTGDKDMLSFDELKYFTGVSVFLTSEFSGCSSLASIQLPPNLVTIGTNAFRNCSQLTEIVIPSSVTTISDNAFSICLRLAKVAFSEGLTSIGQMAFASCSALQRIDLPASVTSISSNAFKGCSSMAYITVADGNTVYDSREDCNAIVNTSTNTIVLGSLNTTYPQSVTAIGTFAFSGYTKLTSLVISDGIVTIGASAFSGCTGLESVVLPGTLTTLERGAFSECSKLTEVILPEGLTTIGQSAFNQCYDLQRVSIPKTVTTIGSSAFDYCYSMVEVTVGFSTPMSISSTTFYNRKRATLYVPTGCVDAFKNANYWKEFNNIYERLIPGDVNHDGSVNVLDVTLVIDYILDKNPENFHYEEANVNGDEYINVLDVTKIIDIILGK